MILLGEVCPETIRTRGFLPSTTYIPDSMLQTLALAAPPAAFSRTDIRKVSLEIFDILSFFARAVTFTFKYMATVYKIRV